MSADQTPRISAADVAVYNTGISQHRRPVTADVFADAAYALQATKVAADNRDLAADIAREDTVAAVTGFTGADPEAIRRTLDRPRDEFVSAAPGSDWDPED